MFNIPKPSPLSVKGDTSRRVDYLFTYLQQLVSALEKAMQSLNKKNLDGAALVNDVMCSNNNLIVKFTDGTSKIIELNINSGD